MPDGPSRAPSNAELVSLDRALHSIAPTTVTVGVRAISQADIHALTPDEADHIRSAVPLRQREFATGRVLLRELLGTHGSIPVRADRSPRMPRGAVGSLAHDRRVAVGAVTRSPAIAHLGIDVEPLTPLDESMAALILRPDEKGLDAHLAFTLKEATYKAWSSAGGPILDHQEVRLDVDDGWFSGEVCAVGARYHGRFAIVDERCLALVVVEAAVAGEADGARPGVLP